MTPLDLPRLRSLLGQATPGEWTLVAGYDQQSVCAGSRVLANVRRLTGPGGGQGDANAALIAEGISALGALLDVAEAAQELQILDDAWLAHPEYADETHVHTERERGIVKLLAAVGRLEQP